jgi:serine phosphatase RsbU (regulator of sigma subunit)
MPTDNPAAATAVAPRVALQCMEIWGGNRRAESAVQAPGIDAWLSSQPYKGDDAGGDIYYVSSCAAGIITRFALADVAGHGDAASDMAVSLRNLMRRSINTPDQTRIARALNKSFGELAQAGRFATALLATYYAPSDHLIICNAGHPRPLWYRASLDRWQVLDDRPVGHPTEIVNLPLGVITPTRYSQFAVALEADDIVVLYTDSLLESADPAGRQLGESDLLALAARAPRTSAESLGRSILDAVADHAAGAPPGDDTTILVLRHTAEDPPRQSLGERIKVTAKMLGLG